ncbi:MAG: CopG family transcriptional regulator [Conexibacter sp.]
MKRLLIRIDKRLDRALERAAAQQGTSKAALIHQAIDERYGPAADGTEALLRMSGMFKGGSPDDSTSINDVVYDARPAEP